MERYMKIPRCCYSCKHYDSDYDEMSDLWIPYCMRNIKFPTVKQSCKRQLQRWPIKKEREHLR